MPLIVVDEVRTRVGHNEVLEKRVVIATHWWCSPLPSCATRSSPNRVNEVLAVVCELVGEGMTRM